jgi:hypothetical protein
MLQLMGEILMAGYNPAGALPDYVVDPSIRKTVDEWEQILYPNGHGRPWWFGLMRLFIKCGFAVKDGKICYDPSYYRHG